MKLLTFLFLLSLVSCTQVDFQSHLNRSWDKPVKKVLVNMHVEFANREFHRAFKKNFEENLKAYRIESKIIEGNRLLIGQTVEEIVNEFEPDLILSIETSDYFHSKTDNSAMENIAIREHHNKYTGTITVPSPPVVEKQRAFYLFKLRPVKSDSVIWEAQYAIKTSKIEYAGLNASFDSDGIFTKGDGVFLSKNIVEALRKNKIIKK